MPVPKYDWDKLKAQWLASPHKVLDSFLKDVGLVARSSNHYIADKTAGWITEKKKIEELAIQEYGKQTGDILLFDTKDLRRDHLEKAKQLLKKAIDFLMSDAAEIKDVETARKLVETAVKMQRDASGLNDKRGKDDLNVTVNNYSSKFNDLLEGADEEGLLRILDTIKRLRRANPNVLGEQGEGESR